MALDGIVPFDIVATHNSFVNSSPLLIPHVQEIFRAPTEPGPNSSEVWAMAWQTWLQLAAACPRRANSSNAYIAALLDAVTPLYRCARVLCCVWCCVVLFVCVCVCGVYV